MELTPNTKADEPDEGLDLSLIRWMLSLSPDERLDVLDQHVADILELRGLNRDAWASDRSSQA